MGGKSSSKSRVAAVILIFCNVLTLIFCITVFSLSLWLIASPSTLADAVKMFENPTLRSLLPEDALSLQLGVAGAMLAGFFLFISVMGFYGAVTGSQFLLFMYATLVILLLLLECAVLYYVSSNLVEKGIGEPNSYSSHALRVTLQCCDLNVTIFSTEGITPPWSCCGVEVYPKNCTIEKVYPKNCHQAIVTWLNSYRAAIYACLAAFHTLLSLCSLVRRAFASHSHS